MFFLSWQGAGSVPFADQGRCSRASPIIKLRLRQFAESWRSTSPTSVLSLLPSTRSHWVHDSRSRLITGLMEVQYMFIPFQTSKSKPACHKHWRGCKTSSTSLVQLGGCQVEKISSWGNPMTSCCWRLSTKERTTLRRPRDMLLVAVAAQLL